jgi:hypothetical protein
MTLPAITSPRAINASPIAVEVRAACGNSFSANTRRSPAGVRDGRLRTTDVEVGSRLGHLEYDWELPISRHLLLGLAKDHALIRYDARGNGLSDWDVQEISLDAWVSSRRLPANSVPNYLR